VIVSSIQAATMQMAFLDDERRRRGKVVYLREVGGGLENVVIAA
jgi:hypothetical protein